MPDSGCFYPPTLVTNVQPVSRIVQEEVIATIGYFLDVVRASFFKGTDFKVNKVKLQFGDVYRC